MANRKDELQSELDAIQKKEMQAKLEDLSSLNESIESQLKLKTAKSNSFITKGDFIIKFFIALFVSVSFGYVVLQGTMSPTNNTYGSGESSLFQLLSVVGPLFGMVLQYYFGAKKKSAEG